ncbi:MAG: single-stranded DNA-binding protein [Elusimicrobia bacterium]|nr:single-stranded DNA-binding protein [Elusimicrobiota bacterium]
MTQKIRLPEHNNVSLIGRLTRDAEKKYTSKGTPACRFDIAVNRRFKDVSGNWQDETSFVPVATWRNLAEICSQRLKKGDPVYVEGKLKSHSWEGKDGVTRKVLEVVASRVQFLKVETKDAVPDGEGEADVIQEGTKWQGTETEENKSPVSEDEVPF